MKGRGAAGFEGLCLFASRAHDSAFTAGRIEGTQICGALQVSVMCRVVIKEGAQSVGASTQSAGECRNIPATQDSEAQEGRCIVVGVNFRRVYLVDQTDSG